MNNYKLVEASCTENMQTQDVIFISMTNAQGGAENVLLMAASAIKGSMIFLKESKVSQLNIPLSLKAVFLGNKSLVWGFIKLIYHVQSFEKTTIVVSTHSYLNAYLGFLKRCGILKSRLIVRECTSIFTRYHGLKKNLYHFAYWIGYPAVDLIICQTELMRDQLVEHNSYINAKKVVVKPNPVDLKEIVLKSNAPNNDPDTKENYICAAGRLIPEKGFDVLIDAFALLHPYHPTLKLFIFGEGKERKSLTELIKKHRLEDFIYLKGHQSNVFPYYKHAKLCVVSSIKEGFPNVLLEMLCVNPAVVTTLCAGGIESIPSVEKVHPNNPVALYKAIYLVLNRANQKSPQELLHYLTLKDPNTYTYSILSELKN